MALGSQSIVLGKAVPVPASTRRRYAWMLEGFLISEFLFQLALLSQSLGGVRVIFRCGAFGASLALLVVLTSGKRTHPAVKPLLFGMVMVAIAIFYPTTNTLLAAVMQLLLYVAIAAPLLWVSKLDLDESEVRRALLIILAFQAASSVVGILQVYFPGRFRGAMSSVIAGQNRSYLRGLTYMNASGAMVMRPSGLTDIPGGVATAGLYATLLSLYFFLTERSALVRVGAVVAAIAGFASTYLSGVKSMMIVVALCLATFVTLFFWRTLTTRRRTAISRIQRRRISAIQILAITLIVVAGGYFLALNIGGRGVTSAIQSLQQGTPTQVYYRERGRFLEYTITTLLPQFPFGAGLGRWGMMSYYFGNPHNPDSAPIWVEINWTAWLLDGGVPLILAYVSAIALAIRFAIRCALGATGGNLAVLAAIIAAYDIGLTATTFNSVPFIGGPGMDFWLLNAMLFALVVGMNKPPDRIVRA